LKTLPLQKNCSFLAGIKPAATFCFFREGIKPSPTFLALGGDERRYNNLGETRCRGGIYSARKNGGFFGMAKSPPLQFVFSGGLKSSAIFLARELKKLLL
jgi:hypothetical protein